MTRITSHEYSSGDRQGQLPPEERLLNPGERVQIDVEAMLATSEELYEKIGLDGNLIATVDAGGKPFMIVDIRHQESNRGFLVVDESFSIEKGRGYKGVEEVFPTPFGRDHHTDRFSYPSTTSRDHFSVTQIGDNLFVQDHFAANGTTVTAHLKDLEVSEPYLEEERIYANRTRAAEARLAWNAQYGEKDTAAPYGYYMNHPILGRESQSVDNGVYLGGSAREAIVVDGHSSIVKNVYDEIKADIQTAFETGETLEIEQILVAVMNKVQDVMPYDMPKTEDISAEHRDDKLIGLSAYITEHAGVCRHQALLAAYLVENLIKQGFLTGGVGVERNTDPDAGGTHAWAVYKTHGTENGKVYVVDPAQTFVGTKEQAENENRWAYRLPTDAY